MENHNSHKQITQRILKNFSHNEKEVYENHINKIKYVYYLDLSDYKYGSEKVKDFGTEVNYFNDEAETFLSTTFEQRFGDVLNKIDSKNFNTGSLNQEDYDAIVFFILSSIYRSKEVLEKIANNQITKLTGYISYSDIILKLKRNNSRISNEMIEIVKNKTNVDFVAPLNCVITIKGNGGKVFFMPISPKLGIKAFESNKNNLNDAKQFKMTTINDEKIIDQINFAAIDTENRNEKLIVAKTFDTFSRICKLLGKSMGMKVEEA